MTFSNQGNLFKSHDVSQVSVSSKQSEVVKKEVIVKPNLIMPNVHKELALSGKDSIKSSSFDKSDSEDSQGYEPNENSAVKDLPIPKAVKSSQVAPAQQDVENQETERNLLRKVTVLENEMNELC